jgi:RNA polymerase sigma factor (sigma-70 family)
MAHIGWSYGGYMTAWVVTQTNRFKAAMVGAGLTNMWSMYGTNDIPNVLVGYFGGIPNAETLPLYLDRSAMHHIDKVTTPTLILHGAQDERVPVGQAQEMYRALKDRGSRRSWSSTRARATASPSTTTSSIASIASTTGSPSTYLQLQRQRGRSDTLPEHVVDPRPGPDEEAGSREHLRVVLAALQTLPELDRSALLMRADEELSYAEIGAALGISEVLARVKVHRARLALAQRLTSVSSRKEKA